LKKGQGNILGNLY